MGNRIDTRVILGSLRYKSAPDTNLMFNVPLIQTAQMNIEFDRNIDISLEQVFDDERQKSDIFRPTCKFSLLFNIWLVEAVGIKAVNNEFLIPYLINSSFTRCLWAAKTI